MPVQVSVQASSGQWQVTGGRIILGFSSDGLLANFPKNLSPLQDCLNLFMEKSFSVGNIIPGENPGTKLLFSWYYPLNAPHVHLLLCSFSQV
jgi:hypothetical protein